MTGNVVDRLGIKTILSTTVPISLNDSIIGVTKDAGSIDPSYAITIASTLAFTVGIIQVV
jgi:hypothetical protein